MTAQEMADAMLKEVQNYVVSPSSNCNAFSEKKPTAT